MMDWSVGSFKSVGSVGVVSFGLGLVWVVLFELVEVVSWGGLIWVGVLLSWWVGAWARLGQ